MRKPQSLNPLSPKGKSLESPSQSIGISLFKVEIAGEVYVYAAKSREEVITALSNRKIAINENTMISQVLLEELSQLNQQMAQRAINDAEDMESVELAFHLSKVAA